MIARPMQQLLAGLLTTGAAFALTAAVVAAPGSDPAPLSATTVTQAPAPSVDSALAGAFGILRRAQTDTEALSGVGPFGANLALARRADTGQGPVWVVPGRGVVCLRAEDNAGSAWSCAPEDAAAAGSLMLSLRSDGGAGGRVFGLVADGAAGLHLVGAGGPLTVADNVYATSAARGEHVAFTSGTGAAVETPVP